MICPLCDSEIVTLTNSGRCPKCNGHINGYICPCWKDGGGEVSERCPICEGDGFICPCRAHVIRTPSITEMNDETYTGPKLTLRYTDANALRVIHHLPGSAGYAVWVVGNPGNASYEWVIERGEKMEHSDGGYGDSDVALRDGLIAMHGLPLDGKGEELAICVRKLLDQFTPEHFDYVTDSNIGTNLKAALDAQKERV